MDGQILEHLRGTLAVQQDPGLSSLDPRYGQITDMAAAQDYAGAAAQVEALVKQGIYDIRLLVFYFYQGFEESGVLGLAPALECLLVLLRDNRAALGPASRFEPHAAKAVTWLLQTINGWLEYHRSKQDESWAGYCALPASDVEKNLAAVYALVDACAGDGWAQAQQAGSHMGRFFEELLSLHAAAPREQEVGGGKESVDQVVATGEQPRAVQLSVAAPPMGAAVDERVTVLRTSRRMVELVAKLQAFEVLIQNERFDRAAVLADELQHELEHFDPRLYLPELFANFGRLFAAHVAQLEEQWQYRDTTMWLALRQFYQVDPVGFVEQD